MGRTTLLAARVAEPARVFAARLAERAQALAQARTAAIVLARGRKPERKWRDARLLWPLFNAASKRIR